MNKVVGGFLAYFAFMALAFFMLFLAYWLLTAGDRYAKSIQKLLEKPSETVTIAIIEEPSAKDFPAKDKVLSGLANNSNLRIVDRSQIEKVQSEIAFQVSSVWNSNKNLAQVGKMLNAQFLCSLKAVKNGEENIWTLECINVNTFQKTSISLRAMDAVYKDNGDNVYQTLLPIVLGQKDMSLDGTWLCEGVKTNGHKYSKKNEVYITPFANFELKDIKAPEKYLKSLKNANFLFMDGNLEIEFANGTTEKGTALVNFKSPILITEKELVKISGENNFGGLTHFDYKGGLTLYDYKVGRITMKFAVTNGKKTEYANIIGDVFMKGERMCVHIGTKSGRPYFLTFTKM